MPPNQKYNRNHLLFTSFSLEFFSYEPFLNSDLVKKDLVKKQTLYLVAALALLLGFLAGVLYSVYRSPGLVTHGTIPGQTEQHTVQKTQALASLEQATQTHPNDASAWAELGHAYFDTQQPVKAISAYTKALELRPDDTEVMTDLGVMHHENHEHQRAIELFDQVLQMRPDHAQARFNKGVVLLVGLKKPEETIKEWRILLRYHPEATSSSGQRVDALIKQMETQMAAQADH